MVPAPHRPRTVFSKRLESGKAALLFLFNHGMQPAQSDVWLRRAGGEYVAVDIMSGRAVALSAARGGVTLPAGLAPLEVRAFKIAPR